MKQFRIAEKIKIIKNTQGEITKNISELPKVIYLK